MAEGDNRKNCPKPVIFSLFDAKTVLETIIFSSKVGEDGDRSTYPLATPLESLTIKLSLALLLS